MGMYTSNQFSILINIIFSKLCFGTRIARYDVGDAIVRGNTEVANKLYNSRNRLRRKSHIECPFIRCNINAHDRLRDNNIVHGRLAFIVKYNNKLTRVHLVMGPAKTEAKTAHI